MGKTERGESDGLIGRVRIQTHFAKRRLHMKKLLSLCLAAILLVTMLPVNVFAAETPLYTREDLIASACNVFPEYASKISNIVPSSSSEQRQILESKMLVKTETRKLNENEQITYNEYSDGTVYVVGSNLTVLDYTDSSTTGNPATTIYTGHISITSNVNGDALLIIEQIKYATVKGGNDYIISKGSVTYKYFAELVTSYISRQTQSNSNPAEITYRLNIRSADGTEVEPFTLYFRVINDSRTIKWVYG